jgi:hypothetical protein
LFEGEAQQEAGLELLPVMSTEEEVEINAVV